MKIRGFELVSSFTDETRGRIILELLDKYQQYVQQVF